MKSSPLVSSTYKISWKKQRFLNLGPKMPYFGIFELKFENPIVIF